MKEQSVSIARFIEEIRKLPSDEPFVEPGKKYTTQKQHWLGWLGGYDGPGYYGRIPNKNRDARFAYNHIVEPKMLAWLIKASGTKSEMAGQVHRIMASKASMPRKSSAIRKLVPWADMASKLFGKQ